MSLTMRKVGILSMQKVVNYGSFMQAYALKMLLQNIGADKVEFIDIIPGRRLIPLNSRFYNYIVVPIKKLINGSFKSAIKGRRFYKELRRTITNNWNVLGLNEQNTPPYDLVVVGSDEVFNCYQPTTWGYTTQLYGDIPNEISPNVVSYAGSFGNTDLYDLEIFQIKEEIASHLNTLKAISVRDENSKKIIETITGREVQMHIDPVLAYGFQSEIAAMNEPPCREDYMIVYTYSGRIKSSQEYGAIQKFAIDNNLKIFSVFCRYDWCDKTIVPENLFEIFRWFRHSKYVVTDTFHGSIFSIITHSNFAVFVRESNSNKLTYLLKSLSLPDRVVDNMHTLASVLSHSIYYNECDQILEKERGRTVNYLKKALESK